MTELFGSKLYGTGNFMAPVIIFKNIFLRKKIN